MKIKFEARLMITLLIFVFLYATTLLPQISRINFNYSYIKITNVRADIDIRENEADVKISYELQNLTKDSIKVVFKVLQPIDLVSADKTKPIFIEKKFIKRLKFKPAEKRSTDIQYQIPLEERLYNSIQFNPSVTLDDSLYAGKVGNYVLNVTLPQAAKKILKSSIDFQTINRTGDRLSGSLQLEEVPLLPFHLKWTELDIDIQINKSIVIENDVANITLVVQNNKKDMVENLMLQDQFSPEHITPISPKEEFSLSSPAESDDRYIWSKNIGKLYPKRPVTVNYSIRFRIPTTHLHGTIGIIDSIIVTISNDLDFVQVLQGAISPKLDAFVIPTGWDFDYKKKDHHLNEHSVRLVDQSFNSSNSNLSWKAEVSYCDKNKDDDYRWSIQNTIVRIQNAFLYAGESGWKNSGGGSSSQSGSYTSNSLKGFSNATVLLRGWFFDYKDKDHHIKTIYIRLKDINYNSTAGTITWNAEANYRDKNADDDYKWKYWYQIVAFNNGAIRYFSDSGDDNGHNAIKSESYTHNSLKGYNNATVLPLGWQFRFKNKDHHINENGFHIRNVDYDSNSGTVDWQVYFNYSDKNFDDDYSWNAHHAILVFDNGESRDYDRGPYSDGGGSASSSFSVDLNDIFVPITWYNEKMDGTEFGVDCGGDSPSTCMDCIENNVNPGNAEDADLYCLNSGTVLATANWALLEYAQDQGVSPDTFYFGINGADRLVDAIAWFVERHMEGIKDKGDWKGAQSAVKTINISGRRNCGADFCGDCEDHSILRAALLRKLGFSWKCIFSADHHNDFDQGQWDECTYGKKKDDGGHTYNIVYYKGKYRILDYGNMQIRYYSSCKAMHATDNIWNDHYNELWSKKRRRPFDGRLLMNYPGNPTCPSTNWNWRTYYGDICK